MIYDLTIVGGGPAGVAAGVYASRKRLKTLFVTKNFEGQSTVSEGIENWIGTIKISGKDLSNQLEAHLRAYAGDIVDIKQGLRASKISKSGENFSITLNDEAGTTIETKTILIATGSRRRKLNIPGAEQFEHKGLTYCATCDGPIFADQDVVVVGGGNAAFESAAQLAAYCKSVTIINRSDKFRADEVTVEKVLSKPNVKAIKNAIPHSVKGEQFVTSFSYQEADTSGAETVNGKIVELPVTGIFVEIGLLPNTDFAKDITELDLVGKIIVDPKTQKAKTLGIWAAGDCTDGLYHQNNIAAGDAVKALEDIYNYLNA
jgi:alkyl hydroperoxide reductase subunit F